ncbi:MAG: amino acid ABC transporter substrate-binding protein [Alteromonadaceae bacterium]|nr:amino acid ABC transporter substrate-binding protein [Alteromonadaceae bacterium]
MSRAFTSLGRTSSTGLLGRLTLHGKGLPTRRALVALSLALMCFEISAAGAPEDDTIVIATGLWAPYINVDGEACEPSDKTLLSGSLSESATCQSEFSGPFIDVVKRAYGGAGIRIEFVSHPWTRNAQLIDSGMADAGLPYYCTEERARQYICSESVVDGEMVLFHRRSTDFDWDTMDDLQGYTIGATLGYFYGEKFEAMEQEEELTVLRIAQDDVNIRLLVRGMIDLMPQDRAVGYAIAQQVLPEGQFDQLTHHPKPLHSRPLHLIFTRATPRGARFAKIFDRRLKEMAASGELDQALRPLTALGRRAN